MVKITDSIVKLNSHLSLATCSVILNFLQLGFLLCETNIIIIENVLGNNSKKQ